jgi:hypothetical protein
MTAIGPGYEAIQSGEGYVSVLKIIGSSINQRTLMGAADMDEIDREEDDVKNNLVAALSMSMVKGKERSLKFNLTHLDD